MREYISLTDEQKRRANAVDLEDFLLRRGERLIPSGHDKRLASDHSVTIRGSEWYDHEIRQGGRAIDFVRMYDGCSFQEAVTKLLNGEQGQAFRPAKERKSEPPKPFALPPVHHSMRRVYAYLMKQRHIDRDIIGRERSMRMRNITTPCSSGQTNTAFHVMHRSAAPIAVEEPSSSM